MALEIELIGRLYVFKDPIDALLDYTFSVLVFFIATVSCLSISRSLLRFIVNRAFL
jgi:hypothetical protein